MYKIQSFNLLSNTNRDPFKQQNAFQNLMMIASHPWMKSITSYLYIFWRKFLASSKSKQSRIIQQTNKIPHKHQTHFVRGFQCYCSSIMNAKLLFMIEIPLLRNRIFYIYFLLCAYKRGLGYSDEHFIILHHLKRKICWKKANCGYSWV